MRWKILVDLYSAHGFIWLFTNNEIFYLNVDEKSHT